MIGRWIVWVLLASCLLPGAPAGAGELALRVLSGAGSATTPARGPVEIHLVLDVTPSMQLPAEPGLRRIDVARASATRFLSALPPDRPVTLHTLGIVSGSECPAAAPAGFPNGEAAASFARTSRPRAEGSLAATLGALAQARTEEDGLARVVVVSDLDDDCGGDLCAAAARLLEANALLDFVSIGRVAPDCLRASVDLASPVAGAAASGGSVPFEVLESGPQGTGALLAAGESGGPAVALAPGAREAEVVVALDPLLRLGPLDLSTDGLRQIEVLDFPGFEVPLREVYLDGVRLEMP